MNISRRTLIAAGGALVGAAAASRVLAQPSSAPMVIFGEGFQNGWSSASWASVQQPVTFDGHTTLKVEGGPWTALVFHHTLLSMAGFSKVTFMINGGDGGGFPLWLKGFANGTPIDCDFQVMPVANTWTAVEAPLAALKLSGQSIDSFCLVNGDNTYKPYYVAQAQLV